MLSIDEASLILLKELSLPSVDIAENILRDAIFRGEIQYDKTRTTVAGSNELIITTGITPNGAQAVNVEDFSEFLNRRKQLLGLVPPDPKEPSQNAIDTPQPPKDKSLSTKERETLLKIIFYPRRGKAAKRGWWCAAPSLFAAWALRGTDVTQ
ncbi:MAG: hypothetical protein ACK4ZS_03715 [Sulfurimicrobium sp.]